MFFLGKTVIGKSTVLTNEQLFLIKTDTGESTVLTNELLFNFHNRLTSKIELRQYDYQN